LSSGIAANGYTRNFAAGGNHRSARPAYHAVAPKMHKHRIAENSDAGTSTQYYAGGGIPSKMNSAPRHNQANLYPLLRLKLVINKYNYDDIAIAFDSAATTVYNNQLDSKYMPGINAPEGLSSFSSDSVQLSVNILPLPKTQAPLIIRLDVEAANSGQLTLERTELDSIPPVYEIWLMDKYKKDSIDLRVDTAYVLNVDKSNSATYGSDRFTVVIRQKAAPVFSLLDFNAVKAAAGAQITWSAKNEGTATRFIVERSSNGGTIFSVLDSVASTGSGTYSFADKTPPAASDEYRLKITDANGKVTYSNTVTLIFGTTVNTITGNISLYPNPANNLINLSINQGGSSPLNSLSPQSANISLSLAEKASTAAPVYNIKIINTSGVVIQTASSSTPKWQHSVAKLLPGTYIITVINTSDNKLVGRSTFVKL